MPGSRFAPANASVRDTGTGLHITTDRSGIDCGALLVAVGLQPNSELGQAAGIGCDNGILVDACCRTDAAGVYAAGDVASHFHPHYNRHIRVEHHDNAIKQGAAAAKNMLGQQAIFADQHWFWSDQYEHYLQSVGIAAGYDEIVLRGNPPERRSRRRGSDQPGSRRPGSRSHSRHAGPQEGRSNGRDIG